MIKRLCAVLLCVTLSAVLLSGLAHLVAAQDEDAPQIAPACLAGTKEPPGIVCVGGAVYLVNTNGQREAQTGVTVTVTLGTESVTGTTGVNPLFDEPVYGIDISLLEPAIWEEITIIAQVGDDTIVRHINVYPDLETQDQRFDIFVTGEADLWGYVQDYLAGGPVDSVPVTATFGANLITVTTTATISGDLPIYQLDMEALGVTAGSTITLTTTYDGYSDQKVVTWAGEPQQENLSVGWMCDDGLPRTSPGSGLPRTSPGSGLPELDYACFWGHVLVDGVPTENIDVHYEISGTTYTARTGYFAGENLPRYGLALQNGSSFENAVATATAVYSGRVASENTIISLDEHLSHRLDLTLSGASALASFSSGNDVKDIAWHNGHLWAATVGGVVRWNPNDGSFTQIATENGLIDNLVRALAPDAIGNFWFATQSGVNYYYDYDAQGQNGQWETYTFNDSLGQPAPVVDVEVTTEGDIWFATLGAGIQHRYFDSISQTWQWETFNTSNSDLLVDRVIDITVTSTNGIWVGTEIGLNHLFYDDAIGAWQWEFFTSSNSDLVSNDISTISVAPNGSVWIGTNAGISHFFLDSNTDTWQWESFTTSNSGLSNDSIGIIAASSNDNVWMTAGLSLIHYFLDHTAGTWQWETFTTENSNIADNVVGSISFHEDGSYWFGTRSGISHYVFDAVSGSWQWETFATSNNGPVNDVIQEISIDADGSVWLATERGISHYFYNAVFGEWQWETFFPGTSIEDNTVLAIDTDPEAGVWAGTFNGVKHYFYDTSSDGWQLETFNTSNSGLVHDWIKSIGIAPDDSVWIGTYESGLSHYFFDAVSAEWQWETFNVSNSGLVEDIINDIAFGDDNSVWIGTGSGGVSHYYFDNTLGEWQWESFTTNNSGLIHNAIEAIAITSDGDIWISTDGGVSHYFFNNTTLTWQWESFTVDELQTRTNYLGDVRVDINGDIWVGTVDTGVWQYQPHTQEWRNYTTADGLTSNNAVILAADPYGNLWMGRFGVSQWQIPIRQSDVSLQLNSPGITLPGQPVTYTLTLINNGEQNATETDLLFTLPIGVYFESATLTPTNQSPLSWHFPSLPANGAPVSLTITTVVEGDVLPGTVLTATAQATTTAPEAFLNNNQAQTYTFVRDPDHADVRVSLSGPPLLVAGEVATYTLHYDNIGGLAATDTQLSVTLPPQLTLVSASLPVDDVEPLIWNVDTLPAQPDLQTLLLTLRVDEDVSESQEVVVTGSINTPSPEIVLDNNQTTSIVPTSLNDAHTLFLVAPSRLAQRYGASSILDRLTDLAQHPLVEGVILDVTLDPDVAAAYASWDENPADQEAANEVARALKALIDRYTILYPNFQYLVIVGSDDIVPFYRVPDQNPTYWTEDLYADYLPADSTIQAALAQNMLLTDDFYADRTPLIPSSPYWKDGHLLFIPDFATGRLVETPEEMIAAIDAFIQNDGVLPFGPAAVSTLPTLTDDLGITQCQLAQSAGISTACSSQEAEVMDLFNQSLAGSFWTTVHGDDKSVGPLWWWDVQNREASLVQTVWANLSCHGGASVPSLISSDQDLAQTILGRGGTYIASTTYTYGSYLGTHYAEAISLDLMQRLLANGTVSLGEALMQVKQGYYAQNEQWFNYLDEKTLLPVTLYGLPMTRFDLPEEEMVLAGQDILTTDTASKLTASFTATPYELTDLVDRYTLFTTEDGDYYSYQGQTLNEYGLPVQPVHYEPQDSAVHGVLLTSANYTDTMLADPLIAGAGILAEDVRLLPKEPEPHFTGWDHEFPYYFTRFDGLFNQPASLNFVLGNYHLETQTERLFDDLSLLILESNSDDWSPPELVTNSVLTRDGDTHFTIEAHDAETSVAQVAAVCDDGLGSYTSSDLQETISEMWQGTCNGEVVRVFLQVVDEAGNVTRSEWLTPMPFTTGNETVYVSITPYAFMFSERPVRRPFADEDILAFDQTTGEWLLFFDGSDVGLASGNVDALMIMADNSILLSFDSPLIVPNMGLVDDSDIVRFVPNTLGVDTAGTFEWFLDGSDVGLTTSSEDIDSVGFTPDGHLVVSTVGHFYVPGAGGGTNADLLLFDAQMLGEETRGVWSLYFDGSDVGLSGFFTTPKNQHASTDDHRGRRSFRHWVSENVWGVSIDNQTGAIYLTTQYFFSVAGVQGSGLDVFLCAPMSLGDITDCNFEHYWSALEAGLFSGSIDALHVSR